MIFFKIRVFSLEAEPEISNQTSINFTVGITNCFPHLIIQSKILSSVCQKNLKFFLPRIFFEPFIKRNGCFSCLKELKSSA